VAEILTDTELVGRLVFIAMEYQAADPEQEQELYKELYELENELLARLRYIRK